MDLFDTSRRYSATTTQLFDDFVVLGGSGSRLLGQLGSSRPSWFLDLAASVGVAALGHDPKEVTNAIIRQLNRGTAAVDNDWQIEQAILLKQRLAELVPGNFPKKVFLCSSGAEAINAAVKLGFDARPGRNALMGFRGAFHGRIGYALDLTDSRPVQKAGFPVGAEVFRLPFPDKYDPNYSYDSWVKEIERSFLVWDGQALGSQVEQISSFVFELVQGEGGIRVADQRAIEFLVPYLRSREILIVVDEVQTGISRTGKFLACEHYRIEPDMVCLSKALGGGMPIGAVVFRADLDFEKKGRHSNTFGGNSVACAAALAVLDTVTDPTFLNRVRVKGAILSQKLDDSVRELNRNSRSVRAQSSGLGLMRKIEFRGKDGEPLPELIEKIERSCLEKGLIVVHAGGSAIRFLPPLTISHADLIEGILIFTATAAEVLNE